MFCKSKGSQGMKKKYQISANFFFFTNFLGANLLGKWQKIENFNSKQFFFGAENV